IAVPRSEYVVQKDIGAFVMRVLKGCSLVAATAILCGVCSSFGAQTFVTLGLTNTLLGNATYGIDPYYPDWVTVGTNGDDGLSLYLGEADGAVFVYPTVYSDPSSGSFLSGKLYGSVNGETDRPI